MGAVEVPEDVEASVSLTASPATLGLESRPRTREAEVEKETGATLKMTSRLKEMKLTILQLRNLPRKEKLPKIKKRVLLKKEPVSDEPKTLTLDEWKAQQSNEKKEAPKFNV